MRDDIERGAARIEETTGAPIVRYRPPYGIFNAAALALVRRNGWRPLLWTHWGRDWQARATPESITARLVGGAVPEGSVLLLHDADDYSAAGSWRRTVAALPRVLDELERAGWPGRSTCSAQTAVGVGAAARGASPARACRGAGRR